MSVCPQELDPSIGNVIGVDKETTLLYGISSDQRALLQSADHGVNWAAISFPDFTKVKNTAEYIPADHVLWENTITFHKNMTSPDTRYLFARSSPKWGGRVFRSDFTNYADSLSMSAIVTFHLSGL